MTTSKKPTCPICHQSNLQLCLPAWFKFDDLDGDIDSTTLIDVDAEASGHVFCTDCESHHDTKIFYIEETP